MQMGLHAAHGAMRYGVLQNFPHNLATKRSHALPKSCGTLGVQGLMPVNHRAMVT